MASNPSQAPPIVRLSYKKGDLIIKEGNYGVSIYKILDGKVGVYREVENGEIPLATLVKGDIFGERTFLNRSSETRSASVRALEDTQVEVWHTARLAGEYDEMPPIIKYITDQVMSRSIRMNNLIVQLASKQQKEKEDPLASKRRFYRKKVDLFCHYRPVAASSKFNLDGKIKDISLNGLAIRVARRNTVDVVHATGDIFVVNAVLPNKKNIELEAEVVAVQKAEKPHELEMSMTITDIATGSKKSLGFFLMPQGVGGKMNIEPLMSAYLVDHETYQPGSVIIEEGSKGDWVYIVLEGQVKVTKRTSVGMLTIDVLKKGSIFGEMALFGNALQARSASVIAADGNARVGVLDTRQLVEDYESLSLELRLLIKSLIMGLKESNEKASALVVAANEKGAQGRIMIRPYKLGIGGMMTEVFEIYVQTHFSAAHSLNGYPGDCARVHGHNWIIDVFVRCKTLNEIGIGLDFRKIKESVKRVLKDLDHFNLNELPAFQDINPTSENIARFLYRELSSQLNTDHITVSRIKVSETPGAGAYYWEEHP